LSIIGSLGGRAAKIVYSFGNMGQSLIFHSIGTYLMYFYIDVVGLDPTLIGTGFLLSYGVWNSINDPIAGYISDRTRTRWGRRIPFIFYCTPLMMMLFILVWSPPVGKTFDAIAIFLYFVFVVAIFEFFYTLASVGWDALYPEMFQDLKERAEVSAYRQYTAMMGIIVGFVLTPPLISYLNERVGNRAGWTMTGAILSSVGGGAFLTSLLGCRERKEYAMAGVLPLTQAMRITLTNRSFITAALCLLMTSWIWSFLSALSPFLVTYMLRGSIADISLMSAPLILSTAACYPLWRKICIRMGTKRAYIIATSLSVSFLLPLILLADSILTAGVIMVFYGFANSGVTLVRDITIADVIDEDELRTGLRREGVYLGSRTFVDRFALALTGASTALVFNVTGFVPSANQPASTITNMRVASASILVVALIGFLMSIKYYPLGATRVAEIREMLKEARQARWGSHT
jgi:GPH family glycoside/pentoside/hexuronide:cation symporter